MPQPERIWNVSYVQEWICVTGWMECLGDRVGQHLRSGTGQITQLKFLQPHIWHQLLFLLPAQFWKGKRMDLCSILFWLSSSKTQSSSGAEVCLWIWCGMGCAGPAPVLGELPLLCWHTQSISNIPISLHPNSWETSPLFVGHWQCPASQRATTARGPLLGSPKIPLTHFQEMPLPLEQ